jgi:hypothetical protein
MTDDLELLSRYMDEPDWPVDLDVARRQLQAAIREDAEQTTRSSGTVGSPSRKRRPRVLVALSGVAAALVVALLLVVTVPGSGQHGGSATAATELRAIAGNAAAQIAPSLGQGQLLQTEQQVSLEGRVTQLGSKSIPNVRAVIDGTVTSWTDASDDVCISATSGPAQFASPVNEAAWTAAGLVVNPTHQPSTSCTSSADASPGGGGVIDVTGLTTSPPSLAHELETGTTQIPQLDQLMVNNQNAGFERAAFLLIGPTVGATPTFRAALYDALADIPGISYLGGMTTHSGASGVGFSVRSDVGTSVLIVDPSSGSLLEAQNFQSPLSYGGISASYVAPPPTTGIGTEGGSGGTTIRWLDPVGAPAVVDASALPAGLTMPTPSAPPAQVTLTTLAGKTLITGAPKGYSNSSVYVQLCPAGVKYEPACQGQMTASVPVDGSYSLKVAPGSWNVGMYYWTQYGQLVLGVPTSVDVQAGRTTHQSVEVAYQGPAVSGVVTLTGAPKDFAELGYMGVQACPTSVQFDVGCAGGTEAYESVSPGSNYSLDLAPGSWNIGAYYRPAPGIAGSTYTGSPTSVVTNSEVHHVNVAMAYQGP